MDTVHEFEADAIAVESNVIGDAIRTIINGIPGGRAIRILLRRSTRKKHIRAEPILAYHERHQAHMVGNDQSELEDQVVDYNPNAERKR